jgi:hypothetical protein
MAKKTFFALEPLLHDGDLFAVGGKIALEAKEATGLLAAGAISADAPLAEPVVESTEEAAHEAVESESPAE